MVLGLLFSFAGNTRAMGADHGQEITPVTITRTLTVGQKGNDIKYLQQVLIQKGFLVGNADGSFGLKTKSAVIAFQKSNKLTPDGKFGAKSRMLIQPTSSENCGFNGEHPCAQNNPPSANNNHSPSTGFSTYTNTGCGYSFQYPNSWSQLGTESNAVNLQNTIMSRMVDFIDTASQGVDRADGSNNEIYKPTDLMHVECYTMGTAIYNYALSSYNSSSDVFSQNKSTITVAGQTALVGDMQNTATVSSGAHPGHTVIPSHRIYVYFMHQDNTRALFFTFDTPLGISDAAETAAFNQVLASFSF